MYIGIPHEASSSLCSSLRALLVPSITTFDDVEKLVSECSSGHPRPSKQDPNIGVDEASLASLNKEIRLLWLKFLCDVLQDYREFLIFVHGEIPVFNTAMYLQTHQNNAPFLSRISSTTMFQNFLEAHIQEPNLFEVHIPTWTFMLALRQS